ncbi:hypothetical protein [Psychroserpens ponticola]|uniref:Adhesin domain-containing protein n=1 Tax=Psychroserpens ponticola TaxID=2932268 RepID=A0ABY7RZD2_9FLAO|nr:hypothetical protein [Psychroserpens ponticola]WCO02498.1 hypothetical protein MUN68_003155 [Psychroserpens ponticola]
MSKEIDVTKDVIIDLNTSYVEIEIDTWNKNTLEVEAFIEGEKLSKEELQDALKEWNLKVEGSGDYVKINSEGSHSSWSNLHSLNLDLEDLNLDLESLESLGDLNLFIAEMPEMPEMPMLPEMPEMAQIVMPELPELPELPDGVTNVSFDTEAYEKEGESYLNKWSKEFGKENEEAMKVWGKEMAKVDFSGYEKAMEKWGEKFGKDYEAKMAVWSEQIEEEFDEDWSRKMEVWQEKYGEKMEKRALILEKRMADREKEMEIRAKVMEKRHDERADLLEKRHEALERRNHSRSLFSSSHNVKKTIKIKMPKKAKLKMNVRHGELKMSSVINNMKADISHGVFVANHIDGSETSINVSYSPIDITTWSLGELNIKYVEDAHIQTVGGMMLNSISSDIVLGNLLDTAIIDGSFGDLTIANIADSFSNLNIILENSEALIALPQNEYSVYFKGNRSKLNNVMTSNKTIENYPNGKTMVKSIVLNAKYSDVVLKN